MKTKLVIPSRGMQCKGCIYQGEKACTKDLSPDSDKSCLIDSSYGLHGGIFVEEKENVSTNKGE